MTERVSIADELGTFLQGRPLGKRHYVLGGGYSEGDGIFQYKQAFAPDGLVPFYVGERVLDRATYDELVRRRTSNAASIDSNYFPAYRAA